MTLLHNEKIILASDNEEVVLTNLKISNEIKSFFNASYKTIFLEDISSIEKGIKSDSNFLKWSFYSALVAFIILVIQNLHQNDAPSILEAALSLSILSMILNVLFYFLSKRRYIIIESVGGTVLEINVRKMLDKSIVDFIHKIMAAKLERVNDLKK